MHTENQFPTGAQLDTALQSAHDKARTAQAEAHEILRAAFDAATGLSSTNYHGYLRVATNGLDQEQLADLMKFRDAHTPEELRLKRSGTGITILVKA